MKDFQYCPYCKTSLTPVLVGTLSTGGKERPQCATCGFTHFLDPKVAVIAEILCEGRILLAKRAVDPAKGDWSLPGGYMDAGEMPDEALRREMREELALELADLQLRTILMMDNRRGIVLVYRAKPASGQCEVLRCADDVEDAQWFRPENVPPNLAFASTQQILAEWMKE